MLLLGRELPDSTHRLVHEMRAARRRSALGACVVSAAVVSTFVVVAASATEVVGNPPVVASGCPADTSSIYSPGDEVDVVSYRLDTQQSLTSLAYRLWGQEVSPCDVLRYNPEISSVSATLPTGTMVRVPNYRDFPVEELAAVSPF